MDAKIVEKIQKLLDRANGTDFEGEAGLSS